MGFELDKTHGFLPLQQSMVSLWQISNDCYHQRTSSLFHPLQKMLMVRNVALWENYHLSTGDTRQWRTDPESGSLHLSWKTQPKERPYFFLSAKQYDEISLLPPLLNRLGCQWIFPGAVLSAALLHFPTGKEDRVRTVPRTWLPAMGRLELSYRDLWKATPPTTLIHN